MALSFFLYHFTARPAELNLNVKVIRIICEFANTFQKLFWNSFSGNSHVRIVTVSLLKSHSNH